MSGVGKNNDPPSLRGALILDVSSLSSLPIWWWWKRHRELSVALKVVTGDRYDNSRTRLTNIFGEEFAIQVHTPREWGHGSPFAKSLRKKFGKLPIRGEVHEIYLWDHRGLTSVFESGTFLAKGADPIPEEIVTQMKSAMEDFTSGTLACSDCRQQFKRDDSGGRYFAGVYCHDCWDGETGQHKGRGGWKAVEAKETYD